MCAYWQLFLNVDAIAYQRARFGRGTGPILMDDVACSGSEDRLIDCDHTAEHNCIHFEDAGVRCQTNSKSLICNLLFNIIAILSLSIIK